MSRGNRAAHLVQINVDKIEFCDRCNNRYNVHSLTFIRLEVRDFVKFGFHTSRKSRFSCPTSDTKFTTQHFLSHEVFFKFPTGDVKTTTIATIDHTFTVVNCILKITLVDFILQYNGFVRCSIL